MKLTFTKGKVYSGHVQIGRAGYDGLRPQNDPKRFRGVFILPPLQADWFATLKEAQDFVAQRMNAWLVEAGLEPAIEIPGPGPCHKELFPGAPNTPRCEREKGHVGGCKYAR